MQVDIPYMDPMAMYLDLFQAWLFVYALHVRKHFSAATLRLQGGPLPVISRVIIPFMGVTTPVTHL